MPKYPPVIPLSRCARVGLVLLAGLLPGQLLANAAAEPGDAEPLVLNLDFTLTGGDGDDLLQGSDGDDVIYGGLGEDRLFGGDGDDIIFGGVGEDQLYGGDGADRFVFDIDAAEADEILDFDPAEGDEIWIRLKQGRSQSTSVELRTRRIDFKFKGAAADRVRLNKRGDVEVRFQDRDWTQLVRTGRSKFDVKINREGDHLRLRFQQKF